MHLVILVNYQLTIGTELPVDRNDIDYNSKSEFFYLRNETYRAHTKFVVIYYTLPVLSFSYENRFYPNLALSFKSCSNTIKSENNS